MLFFFFFSSSLAGSVFAMLAMQQGDMTWHIIFVCESYPCLGNACLPACCVSILIAKLKFGL